MNAIFPVAVLTFTVAVSTALAQEPAANSLQPVVVTNGQAMIIAQPDRAYVARNTVEVRLDAIDRVGAVIDAAGSGGATSIGGVRFDVSNRVTLTAALR